MFSVKGSESKTSTPSTTQKPKEEKKDLSRCLWISGLAPVTKAADLKDICSKHGKVCSYFLPKVYQHNFRTFSDHIAALEEVSVHVGILKIVMLQFRISSEVKTKLGIEGQYFPK